MLKHRGVLAIVSFLVLASLFSIQQTDAGDLPPLTNLAPGTDLRIQQSVDVNVVLVGFGGLVDPPAVLAEQLLPQWNGVSKATGQGPIAPRAAKTSAPLVTLPSSCLEPTNQINQRRQIPHGSTPASVRTPPRFPPSRLFRRL